MLSDEYRSHYVYEDLAPVFVSEENRTSLDTAPFRAFAWDVLKIETISTCSARSTRSSRESATKVLIAMHLVLQDPSSPRAFSSVRNLTQRPKGRTEIAHEVRRVLSLLSGSAPDNVGHGFGATDQSGHEVIAPYTITYVPYDVVASDQGKGCWWAIPGTQAVRHRSRIRYDEGTRHRQLVAVGSPSAAHRRNLPGWALRAARSAAPPALTDMGGLRGIPWVLLLSGSAGRVLPAGPG